tara:strand:+ start:7709 stop:7984 length:276 start_codon:yes stop_codon:yes gene_type:complete
MILEELYTELLELRDTFITEKNWNYARKAYNFLDDFDEVYRNECDEYAGYSENLIRIKNSILMVDRTKAESQFIHGITSVIDIILRELNSN